MIKVLVVDDHTLVRAGIRRLLDAEDTIEVVGDTGSGHDGIKLCRDLNPDVVVLDYGLPDLDGLEVTRQIMDFGIDVKILILTMYDNEEYAIRLLRAGASGFVIKGASPEDLVTGVRKVANGTLYVTQDIQEKMVARIGQPQVETPESMLSDREIQVLLRLAMGATTREVSKALHLSNSTVETYRSRLLEKLNLRNNSDLTRFAIRRGLIDLD
jgi:two-component system, NarL family, invasion response regulator UvrY